MIEIVSYEYSKFKITPITKKLIAKKIYIMPLKM